MYYDSNVLFFLVFFSLWFVYLHCVHCPVLSALMLLLTFTASLSDPADKFNASFFVYP